MKRTQIRDFEKIEQAKDLEDLVKEKKAHRPNRHCGKNLLRHLKDHLQRGDDHQ